NPAHAHTLVRLPAVPGAGPITLRLFDALGRAVRTRPVASLASESTVEVSLLGLTPGFYRVQVLLGQQRVSLPLVVE
ncbi:MAG TPA: T9SS type A sorting domain-containing protein, partial [Hymenobacter sp.]|nr:T9SS type A sorting domain-containing protein [Hymenobacter sp.]